MVRTKRNDREKAAIHYPSATTLEQVYAKARPGTREARATGMRQTQPRREACGCTRAMSAQGGNPPLALRLGRVAAVASPLSSKSPLCGPLAPFDGDASWTNRPFATVISHCRNQRDFEPARRRLPPRAAPSARNGAMRPEGRHRRGPLRELLAGCFAGRFALSLRRAAPRGRGRARQGGAFGR